MSRVLALLPTVGAVLLMSGPSCGVRGEAPTSQIVADPEDGLACGAGHFLDVSTAEVPSDQPAPWLVAECEGDWLVVETNGVPTFEFVPMTPADLREQDYRWSIPREPEWSDETTEIPLLGPVAIGIDGMPIYGPNEAPAHGTADPYTDGILDVCGGHTGPVGEYHYHARMACLTADGVGEAGQVLGYAFDGYPIIAPRICEDEACESVRTLRSSWQVVSSDRNAWQAHAYQQGSGDLDACNGIELADGSYAYVATDAFPYLLACYHGVVPAGAGR